MFYGLNYFEHTLRKYSKAGEDLSARRWKFILDSVTPKKVLDYGSGVPWFRAFKPEDIQCDTYDINPVCPQTGITEMYYDLICFWDSLEHIPNLEDIFYLLDRVNWVAISIPIKPDKAEMLEWRHHRPFEHLHYFSLPELHTFFANHGFVHVKQDQNECPPRQDIWTILYRRSL